MRLLIHAANLNGGGGLAVGLSVLDALRDNGVEMYILASPAVAIALKAMDFPENCWHWVPKSPANSLTDLKAFRKQARHAEKTFLPDVVFTVFGPPLWRPNALHLCGFANGLYFPKNPVCAYNTKATALDRVRHSAKRQMMFRSMQHDTDIIWTETETALKKLRHILPGKEIYVVPNEVGHLPNYFPEKKFPVQQRPRLLMVAAPYPHKNFSLLAAVARLVPEVDFQVTLPETDFQTFFPATSKPDNIFTLGSFSATQLPGLYAQADIAFCPSVAEIFSAAWIEAFAYGLPLLCSGLPEAREICGDAALYFDLYQPDEAAQQIRLLLGDTELRQRQVQRGFQRLKELKPPVPRAEALLSLLQNMVARSV